MGVRLEVEGITLFLLVLARLSGMVLFNPLLSRRNIPAQARMGMVLGLTLILTPTLPQAAPVFTNTFGFAFSLILELTVGFFCGYVFQIFYYMLFFVGDMLDTEFGMSMAKVFDPGTNIQMSVSGNFLSIYFIVLIFISDSHLILIQLFAKSFLIIPAGTVTFTPEAYKYAIDLFIQVFLLAFRLILPFVVAEFTLEVAMGVLMKVIPQITIFVINFQLKLIVGMIMLIICTPVVGSFLDRYIVVLFENMQRSLTILAG